MAGVTLGWPLIRPVLRQTTKLAIKSALAAYQAGAALVAEAGEGMSDIVAEAQHEAGQASQQSSTSSSKPRGTSQAPAATETTPPSPSPTPG